MEIDTTNPGKQEITLIKDLIPVSEHFVIWQWALGEARNPKWARRNVSLDPKLQVKIMEIKPDSFEGQFSDEERKVVISAFLTDKDRLAIAGIQAMKCIWYQGELPVETILESYMVSWPLSEQLASDGKFRQYAMAYSEGRFPPEAEDVRENIQRLDDSFDPGKMLGAPILLSQTGNPPFCVVDGLTRLIVLNSRMAQGEYPSPAFPVIVGVSPDIGKWEHIPPKMPLVEIA